MSGSDAELLIRWKRDQNAEAFAEIITRYAGMVYHACLRVLRSKEDAEDVTQQCFLELATKPPHITSVLGGWLYKAAIHRAINYCRSEQRRRAREDHYAKNAQQPAEPTWDELREHIDEAIAALPAIQRDVIVQRFLKGVSAKQVAQDLAIAERTVRHRQQTGIEAIRKHLREKGLMVGGGLVALLADNLAQAAPPASLIADLGRLAVSGLKPAPKSSPWHWLLSAKGVACVIATVALVTTGWFMIMGDAKTNDEAGIAVPITALASAVSNGGDSTPEPPEDPEPLLPEVEESPTPFITGIVRTPDGVPIEGAIVVGGGIFLALSGPDGRFSIVREEDAEPLQNLNIALGENLLGRIGQSLMELGLPMAIESTFPVTAAPGKSNTGREMDLNRRTHIDSKVAQMSKEPDTQGKARITVLDQGRPVDGAYVSSRDLKLKPQQTDQYGTVMLTYTVEPDHHEPFVVKAVVKSQDIIVAGGSVMVWTDINEYIIEVAAARLTGHIVLPPNVRPEEMFVGVWNDLAKDYLPLVCKHNQYEATLLPGLNHLALQQGFAFEDPSSRAIMMDGTQTEYVRDLRVVHMEPLPPRDISLTLDYDGPCPERLLVAERTVDQSASVYITPSPDGRLPLGNWIQSGLVIANPARNVAAILDSDDVDTSRHISLDIPVGTLRGLVHDEVQRPVPNARVEAICLYRDGKYVSVEGWTDSAGQYELWPVPIGAEVRIYAALNPLWGSEFENYTRSAFFTWRPGVRINTELAGSPSVLAGQISYSDDTPVTGVTLYAYRDQLTFFNANVRDGRFSMKVPSGDYWLEVNSTGVSDSEQRWEVTAPNTDVLIVLPSRETTSDRTPEELLYHEKAMKQMGIVFKMYMAEHRGLLPPLDNDATLPTVQFSQLFPEYLNSYEYLTMFSGAGEYPAFYAGHIITSEEEGLAYLDAIETCGTAQAAAVDILVDEGYGSFGGDVLLRTHENDSSSEDYDYPESQIPVLFEIPDGETELGGFVLYLDGHAEWVEYPGKFPMTEAFIQRTRQLLQR